jgi:SNF2 family DNA or RNA helicase
LEREALKGVAWQAVVYDEAHGLKNANTAR